MANATAGLIFCCMLSEAGCGEISIKIKSPTIGHSTSGSLNHIDVIVCKDASLLEPRMWICVDIQPRRCSWEKKVCGKRIESEGWRMVELDILGFLLEVKIYFLILWVFKKIYPHLVYFYRKINNNGYNFYRKISEIQLCGCRGQSGASARNTGCRNCTRCMWYRKEEPFHFPHRRCVCIALYETLIRYTPYAHTKHAIYTYETEYVYHVYKHRKGYMPWTRVQCANS